MVLRFIELENFLSHRRESLSLPAQGIILLSGNSGAGKSSLICDAVGFCLFGFRATRAKKLEELRHHGAGDGPFRAKIAFELSDGVMVEVERGVDEEGRSYATLVDSRGGFAEGVSAVAAQLRVVLGRIDASVYHRAFVSRQGELSALTAMDSSKRRDFIHQMLGIDALDRVTKRLRADGRERSALIDHLTESAGDLTITELEERRKRCFAAIAEAERDHLAARERAERSEQEAAVAEQALVPLRAARAAIEQAEREIALVMARRPEIDAEIARLSSDLERLASYSELAAAGAERAATLEAVATVLSDLEEQERSAARRLEVGAEIASLDEQIAQAESEAPTAAEPSRPLEEIREERSALRARYASLGEKKTTLEANQSSLEQQGVCATCLRETHGSEAKRLGELFSQQVSECEHQRQEIAARGASVAAELAEAEQAAAAHAQGERARERARVLRERRDELSAQLERLPAVAPSEEQLEEARRRRGQAQEAVRESEQAGAWLEARAGITERDSHLRSERESLDQREQDARQQLAEHQMPAGGDLDAAERAHTDLVRAAAAARVEAVESKSAHSLAQAELADAERHLREHSERLESLERLRAERGDIERLQTLTGDFKTDLVSRLRPELEEMSSSVLATLSGGRHPGLRISEDYEIEIQSLDPPGWLPIRMVSGGEEGRANIALRLALTRLVTARIGAPIRYLVLDEVFASQDPGHTQRMLEVLRGLQATYPQLFLISHVGDLAEQGVVDYLVDVADGDDEGRVSLLAL